MRRGIPVSVIEPTEVLTEQVAYLGNLSRILMIRLAKARLAGNSDLALSLRSELESVFDERDRKVCALDRLSKVSARTKETNGRS